MLAAQEGIHGHTTQPAITVWTIPSSCPVGHYRFHGPIGVPDRLRSIGMCDDLGLRRAGRTVWVIGDLAGRIPRLDGLRGHLPLRYSGRQLHVVVLLGSAIPLRDPACGEVRRGERGTVGGGGCWTGHGEGCDPL